jgi:hypothetical protein
MNISTSTCDRCGHWNCDDCIPFRNGNEVKKKKNTEEKSWVDVLFLVEEKKGRLGTRGRGGEKGKGRES